MRPEKGIEDLLKREREWDNLTKDWDKVAYLTSGAEGYSSVGFDLGVLTVHLSDVKPYANGCNSFVNNRWTKGHDSIGAELTIREL